VLILIVGGTKRAIFKMRQNLMIHSARRILQVTFMLMLVDNQDFFITERLLLAERLI
jgi:hypothetical protein